MGEMNISINKRPFQSMCKDGEEDTVRRLAEDLAARVSAVKKTAGEAGDARLFVLTALTLCDELNELQAKLNDMREEIAVISQARQESEQRAQDIENKIVQAFEDATQRIQDMTKQIETAD